MPVPQNNGVTVVNLPPILNMSAAVELKPVFETALAQGAIRIEANDVERVATPGLQLLAAVAKSCVTRGVAFEVGSCAAPLRDGANLLGLAVTLGLDGDENE